MTLKRIGLSLLGVLLPLFLVCGTASAAEVWNGTEASGYGGGSGTAQDPYLIENGAQLAHMGSSGHYKLTADIYLNDSSDWESWSAQKGPAHVWKPLWGGTTSFSGTLDGAGHTIYGLYTVSSGENTGLIGQIWYGTVKDLSIAQSAVFGGTATGAVAGAANCADLSNCTNSGLVSASGTGTGGIAGTVYGEPGLRNCANSGTVQNTANGSDAEDALQTGGVVGSASQTELRACVNTGPVSARSSQVGGVAGWAFDAKLISCENAGAITGLASSGRDLADYGGIVGGANDGAGLTECENRGPVSAPGSRIGGLAGQLGAEATAFSAVNRGAVSGQTQTGGIVGAVYGGTVNGGENTGTVRGLNANASRLGGVAGEFSGDTGAITGVVNRGDVIGGERTGGIAGEIYGGVIDGCENTGAVSAVTAGQAGGIVGSDQGGLIRNVSNAGEVTAAGQECGGLVGILTDKSQGVLNSRNTGAVTAASAAGGLTGTAYRDTVLENCWTGGLVRGANPSGSAVGRDWGCQMAHCYYLAGTYDGAFATEGRLIERSQEELRSAAFLEDLNSWVRDNQRSDTGYAGWETASDRTPAPTGAAPGPIPVTGQLTLHPTEHGQAVLSRTSALSGTEITVTLTADEGYQPDQVWYVVQGGEPVYAEGKGAVFTFSMPYGDADVYASFRDNQGDGVWDGTVASAFAGGDGTQANPYRIVNGAQLAHVKDYANQKKHFRLMADIVLNDTESWQTWTADRGPEHVWTPLPAFAGQLDGNGHTISGLYTNGQTDQALFARVLDGGQVRDLTIDRSQVFGTQYVGAVAAWNSGILSDCVNNGSVSATGRYAGGIAGRSNGPGSQVEHCVNRGQIRSAGYDVGGILGMSEGKLLSCVNEGDVTSTALKDEQYPFRTFPVGGIAGEASGTISDCRNSGRITGYYGVGGIAAEVRDGTVQNCVNEGTAACLTDSANSNSGAYAAGIAASAGGTCTIQNCENRATVTARAQAGGICALQGFGGQSGTVSVIGCVNSGDVTTGTGTAGGITGFLNARGNDGVIERCENTGAVTSEADSDGHFLGGVLGYAGADGGSALVRNCRSTGPVTGNRYLGGLVGYLQTASSGSVCRVETSCAAGTITGRSSLSGTVAGIYGRAAGSTIAVENCYCLAPDSAAVGRLNGSGTETVSNVRALSAGEMGRRESFSGFDFDTVWSLAGEGTCPTLKLAVAETDLGGLIQCTLYRDGSLLAEAGSGLKDTVYVVEATYQKGQMLDSGMVSLAPGQSFVLHLDQMGEQVKAFVLDKQLRPLCPAQTLTP